jgi:hypothetical protein
VYVLSPSGFLTHPKYKILSVLSRDSMFRLAKGTMPPPSSKKKRKNPGEHEIKPLEFVWSKLGKGGQLFSAANTVHIDDLSRTASVTEVSGPESGSG